MLLCGNFSKNLFDPQHETNHFKQRFPKCSKAEMYSWQKHKKWISELRLRWRTVSSGKKMPLLSKAWKCEREDKTQFPHLPMPFTWDTVWNRDGRFRADLGVNYNLTGGYRQILNSLSTLIRFLPKIVHNLLDTCFVPLLPQKNVTGMQIPAFTSLSSPWQEAHAKAPCVLRNYFSGFFKNRLILSLQVSQPQVNTGLTLCFLLPHRQV